MNEKEHGLDQPMYNGDIGGIKREVMQQLVFNDDVGCEKTSLSVQIPMPNDWYDQIIKATERHNQSGIHSTHILMPLSWLEDFKNKILTGSDPKLNEIYDHENNLVYGAHVIFGSCDRIFAASKEWLKNQ